MDVYHIEKVNEEMFLTGGRSGFIELINKNDLKCLSHLQIQGVYGIT